MSAWFDRLTAGLSRTREQLGGQLNVLLRRGPDLDATFWEDLEDALIAADMGMTAVTEMTERLRDAATRRALPDAAAVIACLEDEIAREFPPSEDLLEERPVTVLVVGINGTGKTTTVGKLAKAAADAGTSVVIGSADTFRAAAIEQLRIWAERAGVPVVERERGTDPASVAFESVREAEQRGAGLLLIDTAGRLHTSKDLMAELTKVARVVQREGAAPMRTLLVMDATTGQNGLQQAREFDDALNVDGIVLTKLDGTARGGIAVAIARELGIPILRIGVGESIEDLRPFDAHEFAAALVGGRA
ncbi:MAG TPA: signal recognition particle-docking protein FtsY [Coriobacteriia bacterium]|nr:signal recognition particle-docking protein FtsY [Coriobacteriia bacterium]